MSVRMDGTPNTLSAQHRINRLVKAMLLMGHDPTDDSLRGIKGVGLLGVVANESPNALLV